ncbi:hypothetical protein I4U23_001055 [Adineta vaga]|nr:hypothetical protein I4U23_001055 [Adineta vaga]
MGKRSILVEKISMQIFFLIFLLKFKLVISISNHSCYTCIEPLVGYTDHADSCRFFDSNSLTALSYVKNCDDSENGDYTGEYECRKLVISYRSVETYLRRDCAPKGLCSWKDKTQSMINTPVSNCVYTDDNEQKLECIYCCDTPLCNRTKSFYRTNHFLIWLFLICCLWRRI